MAKPHTSDSKNVWLITGCSSETGFGATMASELLKRGHKVIATARKTSVPAMVSLQRSGASLLSLDVAAPPDQIAAVVADAHNIFGRIDFLINNAGYNQTGTIEETSYQAIEAQFSTNFFGLLNITRAVLPYMRKQRSGVIANISSTVAWSGGPGMGFYMASKAAVSMLTEALTAEVAELGISVCVVEPGAYRSGLLQPHKIKPVHHPSETIADYNGTVSRRFADIITSVDGQQPGDVAKAVLVLVDVLTDRWGKGIPTRLVLGKDGHATIRAKCQQVLEQLDDWEDKTTATDFV